MQSKLRDRGWVRRENLASGLDATQTDTWEKTMNWYFTHSRNDRTNNRLNRQGPATIYRAEKGTTGRTNAVDTHDFFGCTSKSAIKFTVEQTPDPSIILYVFDTGAEEHTPSRLLPSSSPCCSSFTAVHRSTPWLQKLQGRPQDNEKSKAKRGDRLALRCRGIDTLTGHHKYAAVFPTAFSDKS